MAVKLISYFKVCGFILIPVSLAMMPTKITTIILSALLCFLACIVVVVSLHIFSKRTSESHTFRSLLQHYQAIMFLWIFGWRARKQLERESKDCSNVQEKLLMEILKTNKNTVYGKEYNFESIESSREFMVAHPLTTKCHYKEYVNRIAKGEDAVLTNERPHLLAVTSGTTGPGCMIPRIPSQGYPFFVGRAAITNAMYTVYPKTFNLQRILGFYSNRKQEITEGGIPKVAVTGLPPSGAQLAIFSTPGPGFHILNSHVSTYVHLLFGLKDRNIGTIFTNLAQTMYRSFLALEENWERLVKDIEEGRIGPDIELDAETRSELNGYLKPDKKRAQELKKEFQTGFAGIAPRIWPNLNIILCVTTGPEELYAKKLRAKYIGHVPMYSAIYSSTETLIGVNLWPKDEPAYLPVLSAAFFEFLPIDECRKEQPETRLPEDLELDFLYELVVTTRGGLYRYRMGDVVKVVRYHNKCPVFEFQYRSGRLLTGHVTEKMMYNALMTSLQCFDGKVQLEEYTCAESVLFDALPETGTEEPKGTFHVVFVELNGVLEEDEKLLLQGKLDEALRNLNILYDERRVLGVDLSTRLYRVKQGTFDKLREYLMSVNPMTSPIQFKTPRVITSKEAGKLLLGNLHL